MTSISIVPVSTAQGAISYCAVAGERRSEGETAGKALDALASQLSADEGGTLVIVQNLRPDRFFDAAQQQRLAELMERRRSLIGQDGNLTADEQAELEQLVDAELRASAARAAILADEAGR